MVSAAPVSSRLPLAAFATLLLLALMFGANHVAARVAFNHGLDVATAVAVRSLATALVVGLLVWQQQLPLTLTARLTSDPVGATTARTAKQPRGVRQFLRFAG